MSNTHAEVRNERYIHTLECSTSSKLCDLSLNREETLSVADLKPILTTPMWTNALTRADGT